MSAQPVRTRLRSVTSPSIPLPSAPVAPTSKASPPLIQLVGAPPLLDPRRRHRARPPSAPPNFEVFGPSTGTDLGSIDTNETVTNLLALTNAEFTVTSVTAADGGSASDLPAVGSVYDAFNLSNGFENIYTAIPGTAGGADTVTDTLVTPFGNVNLDSLFGSIDAAAPAATGRRLHRFRGGRQQHRCRRFQHRRLHPRPHPCGRR